MTKKFFLLLDVEWTPCFNYMYRFVVSASNIKLIY